ncbi:PREDICTED: cyclin-P3-1-like isoform X2 [Erythranthe guttata]|nr:PREDICTED: cyclin-P3-1-like isoform X1 [Erythranthe guttata]XP_012833249.1 PREDICTED: cyclin-P3-1-like isoform X2 [Erythranthe guttata]|eukprot:XP_012833248.1 PREDICTED: cyclin-P3-1-like isoform X1 [Erythranthe guttata]
MGSLALEKEIIGSLDYISLGLKDPIKDYIGKPRVLSLVSTFLERSIQTCERNLETSLAKDDDVSSSIFYGLRAPSLTIQQYIDRIFKYSCCSPSCFIIAHIYVDRFIQRTNLRLTSLNVHRLLITSVMVAAKFMDDAFFDNAFYARVGGVSTTELNKLEIKFLFGVDFRLHVNVQTFRKYCSLLKKQANDGIIERPLIHSYSIEESCTKNDDSVLSSFRFR